MALFGTIRSIGEALGFLKPKAIPVGCALGKAILSETRRSAELANFFRPRKELQVATRAKLQTLFPELDVDQIRVRTGCRLPSNKFSKEGSIYAMTFDWTIYWRDKTLTESDPTQFVKLVHEVVHVDQYQRLGGEKGFACKYGEGYLDGSGELPSYISKPTAYHRNPLEAEAYNFEAQFRDENGRVVASKVP